MKISSPVFSDNETMPEKYTCRGDGVNPPLQISDVPPETKSLVLIMRDPDAPSGDFVHWLLWNVDPKEVSIEENSMPEGSTSGMTSNDSTGYVAPCPPAGIHRYQFQLFALKGSIDLPETADIAQLETAIDGKVITNAMLVGLVGQK